jgi:large subunit ribosomal protein L9
MQIILLERVESLGQMGDVVNVKSGYARNFLLPRSKALRATKENISYFDAQKKVLEAENLKRRDEAQKVAQKMTGLKVAIIRQASEAGQLYGSVTARDIADAVVSAGYKIGKEQVRMDRAYKLLGLYPVRVSLHPEVALDVTLNIARSLEEAKIQEEKGVALINARESERAEEAAAANKAAEAAEKLFAAPAAEEASDTKPEAEVAAA